MEQNSQKRYERRSEKLENLVGKLKNALSALIRRVTAAKNRISKTQG